MSENLHKGHITLGIDPGSIKTGYGIIESSGNKIKHIDNGLIIPDKNLEFKERVFYIFKQMEILVRDITPDSIALEDIFIDKNASSALKLGHIRGVAMSVASLHNVELFEYTPTRVKKSVVGNGRATKEQIQLMVRIMLGLKELPYEDAADALAIAITHTFTRQR